MTQMLQLTTKPTVNTQQTVCGVQLFVFVVRRHHFQKVNKSSNTHFRTLFSQMFLFLMFLNSQINLIILKTDDDQFTLTTKKITAYHL